MSVGTLRPPGAPPAVAFSCDLDAPLFVTTILERFPQASLAGDRDCVVDGFAALNTARPGALAFTDHAADVTMLAATAATVVIASACDTTMPIGRAVIVAPDPRALFIDLVAWRLPASARPPLPLPGRDRSARIDASAHVSPAACVGADVVIGAGSIVGPGAVLYRDTHIGADCTIGPNAVIGYVGLAYHDRDDGERMFFPHLAGVRIGDRVDVGAQSCVCRGMLSHTRIGDDAKLGSLVYISHGVVVDGRAWISAGTAIAGHAHIAASALLGIGSVVVDNVTVGTGALISGGSVVTRSAAAGAKLVGVPARDVPTLRRFGPTPRD